MLKSKVGLFFCKTVNDIDIDTRALIFRLGVRFSYGNEFGKTEHKMIRQSDYEKLHIVY